MNTAKLFLVVILSHGGCELLIERLAKSDRVKIGLVLLEMARIPKRTFVEKIRRSMKYDGPAATISKLVAVAAGDKTGGREELLEVKQNQAEIVALCEKLGIETAFVDDYHSEDSKEKIRSLEADLGILYGTNIIRKSVFSIPANGSINLHQGLAPYYRGGPSIFWELFNDEKNVGVTVHFVAPKVDTGDILRQETVSLAYDFTKYGLDFETFISDFRENMAERCAAMVADSAESIADGTATRTVQDPELGVRYRLPTYRQKNELISRLRKRMNGSQS